jgi:hypothetical protein
VLENYFTDDLFLKRLAKSPKEDLKAAALEWIKVWGNSLRWDDLCWLRSLTKLPILPNGIQHPDDVRRAKDYGMDGICCSNHGGRQADGGLPALDALPAVVEAADGMPVPCDSGVRSGSDVAKASALRGHRGRGRSTICLCIGRGRHRRDRVPTARHPRRTGPTDGHRRLPHHRRSTCSGRPTHLTSSIASERSGARGAGLAAPVSAPAITGGRIPVHSSGEPCGISVRFKSPILKGNADQPPRVALRVVVHRSE